MNTLTVITEADIRTITDADAENRVARSNAPESVKEIMLHYTKEIYFLQYVLSNSVELTASEYAQLRDEVRELREEMDEKIDTLMQESVN